MVQMSMSLMRSHKLPFLGQVLSYAKDINVIEDLTESINGAFLTA